MLLDLAVIRLDGGTQPRATISSPLFEEYAQAIADGATLPPIVVYHDGAEYWLADGYHRFYAHQTLGVVQIEADVRQGSRRDAVLFSVGANADHGWRRSNDDKRRAVLALLNDSEWASWSDREIARRCYVSAPFVGQLRPSASVNIYSATRTFSRGNNTAEMTVERIGRAPREVPLIAGRVPDAKPRLEIAIGDEVAMGTASAASGFKAEKLAAFARAGEIAGARKEAGSWVFETAGLKEWMGSNPRDASNTAPSVYDHEANRPMLATVEMLEALIVGVSPQQLLRWWASYSGKGFEPDTIARASSWINYFAEGYPAAERSRQSLLARITEEAA